MGNIILGRKLNYKQIAALKDGTKIYIKELGRFGDEFKSSVAIKEGNIVRKQWKKRFYTINKDMGKIFNGTIDAEFYEVCVLDEMKEITFEEAKSLPEGTLVFAKEAKGYGDCYTEKKDNCLKELYTIYRYNFNNTNEYEKRGVKLYISKKINTEAKPKEKLYNKPSTTVLAEYKGVKIGDRVKRKSDGELGTVIDFYTSYEEEDDGKEIFGICYDNKVGIHSLSRIGVNKSSCKYGHGRWESKNNFEVITSNKLQELSTIIDGNKVEITYEDFKAIARCCPEDTFNEKIGLGIALERLGKQLQEEGEKEVKENELRKYPLFKKEDWLKFLSGEVVLKCKTKEDAKELLRILHSMGYKWGAGNSLLETTYFTHDTVYEICSNNVFCPYEGYTKKKAMLYK